MVKTQKQPRGGKRPGAGRPAGEKTALVRIYSADRAKLRKHGKTDALAVRSLIGRPGKTATQSTGEPSPDGVSKTA